MERTSEDVEKTKKILVRDYSLLENILYKKDVGQVESDFTPAQARWWKVLMHRSYAEENAHSHDRHQEDPVAACAVCNVQDRHRHYDSPEWRSWWRELAKVVSGPLCSNCYGAGWVHVMEGVGGHIERCDRCAAIHCDLCAFQIHRAVCDCHTVSNLNPQKHRRVDWCDGTTTKLISLTAEDEETIPMAADPTLAKKMAEVEAEKSLQSKLDSFRDLEIVNGTTNVLVLPVGMDAQVALHWLQKKSEEAEKTVAIDHRFPGYYPTDAAFALYKAIVRTFGFASQESKPGFFSVEPPATIGIESSPNKIVQVPWGRLSFHGIDGFVETSFCFVDGFPTMNLIGKLKKKHVSKIEDLVYEVRKILREESIYRGKAIQVDFSEVDPESHRFDPLKAPKFLDTSKTDPSLLILNEDVAELVRTNLFNPVQYTEMCRKLGIPLRRAVLLEGPFGTGKTLTAAVEAKLCELNGWTYVYITDPKHLPQALRFAKNYSPALIFVEDIDKVVEGTRDEEMNIYLNAMDGIDRKGDEVMVVFTTNNIEKIHPAFMRPGRIDAIIGMEPPDEHAMERILRMYGKELIDPSTDLSEVSRMLAGKTPAIAREVIDRSKLRAVPTAINGQLVLRSEHLIQGAHELLEHAAYSEAEVEEAESDVDRFAGILGAAVGDRIVSALNGDLLSTDVDKLTAANGKSGALGLLVEAAKQASTAES